MSSFKPTPSPPLSTISDDHKTNLLQPQLPPPAAATTYSDTWSESATTTLINSWGTHFLELNRGKLTHTHWLSVADSVNSIHPNHHRRTHVQCQNRIDTLKKRFKIIKQQQQQSNSNEKPSWPHFRTLDYLIGGNTRKKPRRLKSHSPESSPEPVEISPESSPERMMRVPAWKVPVGPRTKRCVTKRKYEVVEERERQVGRAGETGTRVLAEAIGRLGRVYERVELEKNRQMVELEKQRMLFFRDLEMLRMEFFMESRGVFMDKI